MRARETTLIKKGGSKSVSTLTVVKIDNMSGNLTFEAVTCIARVFSQQQFTVQTNVETM